MTMPQPDYAGLVAQQHEYLLSVATRPISRWAQLEALKAMFTENHKAYIPACGIPVFKARVLAQNLDQADALGSGTPNDGLGRRSDSVWRRKWISTRYCSRASTLPSSVSTSSFPPSPLGSPPGWQQPGLSARVQLLAEGSDCQASVITMAEAPKMKLSTIA
jgi:hypothetical protein